MVIVLILVLMLVLVLVLGDGKVVVLVTGVVGLVGRVVVDRGVVVVGGPGVLVMGLSVS